MRILSTTNIPLANPNPPDPILHAEYPREPLWQKAVERMFRQVGWSTIHFWNTMHSPAGWPDLIAWCTHPGRQVMVIAELKTETGRVTPKQRETLLELAAAGVPTFLWRPSSIDEIVAVLSEGVAT
jgi:hypothetical protein